MLPGLSSLNGSNVPRDQCLANLRQSILQVIHHKQVSDEVRSFLTELVKAILHYAEQGEAPPQDLRVDSDLFTENDPRLPNQEMSSTIEPCQIGLVSQNRTGPNQILVSVLGGLIQVTNTVTGKQVTFTQEDLIHWAKQNGIDQQPA